MINIDIKLYILIRERSSNYLIEWIGFVEAWKAFFSDTDLFDNIIHNYTFMNELIEIGMQRWWAGDATNVKAVVEEISVAEECFPGSDEFLIYNTRDSSKLFLEMDNYRARLIINKVLNDAYKTRTWTFFE